MTTSLLEVWARYRSDEMGEGEVLAMLPFTTLPAFKNEVLTLNGLTVSASGAAQGGLGLVIQRAMRWSRRPQPPPDHSRSPRTSSFAWPAIYPVEFSFYYDRWPRDLKLCYRGSLRVVRPTVVDATAVMREIDREFDSREMERGVR